MENIFRFFFIFLTLLSIISFSFSQTSSIEGNFLIESLKDPQKQETLDLDWEKEEKKKETSWQFRRSEIIFFISFPFTFLVNNFLFGSTGTVSLLTPEEYFSSFIVTFREFDRTQIYRYRRIEHPQYHRAAFNATEILIWVNSFIWSLLLALNDHLENSAPDIEKLKFYFDGERFVFDFFSERF